MLGKRGNMVFVFMLAAAMPTPSSADVVPGTTLDATTAEQAKDLLPPEILAHYEKGAYSNPIVAWPKEKTTWPTDFEAATDANLGQVQDRP